MKEKQWEDLVVFVMGISVIMFGIIVFSVDGVAPVSAGKPTPEPFVSSITINQTDLRWWQPISLTLVYPAEAARQSRQPQYPNKPTTQIDCYQNDLLIIRRAIPGH